MSDQAWAVNWEMNDSYFPRQDGLSEIYADTNEVTIDPAKDDVVIGFYFQMFNNRIKPALIVYNTVTGSQSLAH